MIAKGRESLMYQEICTEFQKYLLLKSTPIAVKMLKTEEEIPAGAIRPLKDLGYHLSLCQTFALARRQGKTIAMLKEDNWCCEPVIGYGFEKPPEYFLEGNNRYPDTARTLEAGRNWATNQLPKFEPNKYVGIVAAPLDKANFEPDVIIVYCDPAQLTQILITVNWIDGNDVICALGGHAVCVYAVVPVIQNDQYQISIPCIGDRKRAGAQDDELIFSFPLKKAEDLIAGFKANLGFPIKYDVMPEYQLPKSYVKIGKMMGFLPEE
jgi:uncharacterized protein (DUF169 family)